MTRFPRVFSAGRGGPALIAYVMAGDPDIDRSREHALALVAGGAAAIELGVPFSDPVADGPTIQRAAVRSLSRGTTPDAGFALARSLRKETDVPLAIMTYYNLLYHRGLRRFVDDAAAAGVDGVIVPDLPVEEAGPLLEVARAADVDTVFLASPATDDARMRRIAAATRGFLYLVSTYGVTGARASLAADAVPLVRRAKKAVGGRVPVAVGFGVSSREHVEALGNAGADGVVVGSAIVERIEKGASPKELETFVRGLAS